MKQKIVRRASALVLAGCLLAGSSLPAFAAASAAKRGTPSPTMAATPPCAT